MTRVSYKLVSYKKKCNINGKRTFLIKEILILMVIDGEKNCLISLEDHIESLHRKDHIECLVNDSIATLISLVKNWVGKGKSFLQNQPRGVFCKTRCF